MLKPEKRARSSFSRIASSTAPKRERPTIQSPNATSTSATQASGQNVSAAPTSACVMPRKVSSAPHVTASPSNAPVTSRTLVWIESW